MSSVPRPAETSLASALSTYAELQGREIVVDAASPYVYLGTLAGANELYLTLADADVHDLRDTKTSRELYVVESRRHGIRSNRRTVQISLREVVSFSALEDVVI